MARATPIRFLRTSRAALNTQSGASGLLQAEPYLITDEGRLAVGTAPNAYVALPTAADVNARVLRTGDLMTGPLLNPFQPCFMARRGYTAPGGSHLDGDIFQTTETHINVTSGWNGSRFTCSIPGHYEINAVLTEMGPYVRGALTLFKNGGNVGYNSIDAAEGVWGTMAINAVIYLAVADYIDFRRTGPAGMPPVGASYFTVSGHLIG